VRTLRTAFLASLTAAALAACSGGEPQVVVPKPAAPILPVADTTKSNEEREATRARLARQEAAARMTEKLGEPAPRAPEAAPRPPEPPPSKAAPAPRAPEPKPRPTQAAAATPAPAPQAPPARPAILDASSRDSLALVPNAGFVETPRAEAPKPEAPKPEAPKVEAPRREPPVQVASAAPVRLAGPTRVLNRVEPDFPRAAFQARVDRGLVKARMTLDGNGNVMRVDIVDANPRRVFDNAVTAALTQWKFNDGAAGRTYDTEVVFQR